MRIFSAVSNSQMRLNTVVYTLIIFLISGCQVIPNYCVLQTSCDVHLNKWCFLCKVNLKACSRASMGTVIINRDCMML